MKSHGPVVTRIKCVRCHKTFCSAFNFNIHCDRKHDGWRPEAITTIEVGNVEPENAPQATNRGKKRDTKGINIFQV